MKQLSPTDKDDDPTNALKRTLKAVKKPKTVEEPVSPSQLQVGDFVSIGMDKGKKNRNIAEVSDFERVLKIHMYMVAL